MCTLLNIYTDGLREKNSISKQQYQMYKIIRCFGIISEPE